MQENQDFIRGHRVENGIIDWSDCKLTKEEIDIVCNKIKKIIDRINKLK